MYLADIEYYLSDDAGEIGTVRYGHRGTVNHSIESDSAGIIGGGSAVI